MEKIRRAIKREKSVFCADEDRETWIGSNWFQRFGHEIFEQRKKTTEGSLSQPAFRTQAVTGRCLACSTVPLILQTCGRKVPPWVGSYRPSDSSTLSCAADSLRLLPCLQTRTEQKTPVGGGRTECNQHDRSNEFSSADA